jgi:predicted RND superfamily exporter protein
MRRLLAVPIKWPRLTLAIMVVLTCVFGFFAREIRVDSSFENLLPTDDPAKTYYDDVKADFGDEEIVVIGVFADDVFTPATLAKIDRLTEQLAALDGVRQVISPTNVQGIEIGYYGLDVGRIMRELPRTAEEAAEIRRKILATPIYIKNIVAADGRAAGISVIFDNLSDEEFERRGLEEHIRTLVAAMGGPEQWAVTGIPTIKVNGARLMETDVLRFTPLSMLLVVIVLAIAFRTWRGVLVPLTTVIIGVVWTTGFMVLMGTAITMGTLVLNPLLMVVGIASGIHLISQYYIEVEPGRQSADVVRHALDHVASPIMVAAATTLIGFGTLIFTPIRAVREFGEYSVFGITVILLAAFTVVPALLTLLPVPPLDRIPDVQGGGWLPGKLKQVGALAVRKRRAVLVCGLLVLLVSIWGITRIRVETDYISFFDPGSFIRVENSLIGQRLAGTQPLYVVIEGGEPQAVTRLEVLAAMRDLQEFIDRQPGVDKTISLLDYLALVRRVLQPEATGDFPESQSEVEQTLLLINATEIAAVLNRDASRANIVVRTSLSGSTAVGDLVARVQEYADSRFPRGVGVRPTGTVVLLSQSADALAWGQVTGLWQELAALLALLSFMFLSVRVGIMALIPNVFPTFLLFGIMGWSGITLNISTSMIAAIAIGIAIDDTIHLLSTFNSELRKTGSQAQAVINAMGSAGQAAFFIALALSAGFFIVCLSNFQPVRHFGLLSGVTMGVAVLVEFFLTPALVTTTKIITLWDLLFLKLGPEPHKEIPLFAGLRPFQAKVVVLMGRLEAAPAGSHIAHRGELKPEMYVLLNGRVEFHRGSDDRIVRSYGRGDVIGEMGLVRQRPRTGDVVATEDTEYLALDQRFLERMQRQYPRIASTVFFNLTRILSDRLETTTDALAAADGLEGSLQEAPSPAR